jgi:hypothetical protein
MGTKCTGTKCTQFRKSRKFFCSVMQGLKTFLRSGIPLLVVISVSSIYRFSNEVEIFISELEISKIFLHYI